MQKNRLTNVSLIEIINTHDVSVRLFNCIQFAISHELFPIKTVADYLNAGDEALNIFLNLPNMGIKTAKELDNLIKNIVDVDTNNKLSILNLGSSSFTSEIQSPDEINTLLENFRKNLSEREYEVLKYRSIKNMTLEDIGEIYNVTRERVRQIEKKVISKLIKVYRSSFNRVIKKIDRILDESFGEVDLFDTARMLNIKADTLKILIYICGEECTTHVRIRDRYILRSSTESNHSTWNETIDEVLYSLKWPIYMNDLYDAIDDIPHSYIERYLLIKRGSTVQDDNTLSLRKISQIKRMIYVLRDAGRPLHISDITMRYNSMFEDVINEHNANSIVARMEEALIVDRGIYTLYELLNISDKDIMDIRSRSYKYIRKEKKYVSSKVLYEELFKEINFPAVDSPYIVHGILQDDDRFLIRRGFMVGIRDHFGLVDFKPLTEEISELVAEKGPLSVSQVKAMIADQRNVLSASVSKILEDSESIIKVAPGVYNTLTNIFGEKHLIDDLKLAIRIALFDHDQVLFELTSNIRRIKKFEAIDITKFIISSVIKVMSDVMKNNNYFSIHLNNEKVRIYNSIVMAYYQNKSKMDIELEVKKKLGIDLSNKYISVDYRMQSYDVEDANKNPLNEGGELNSILASFGI